VSRSSEPATTGATRRLRSERDLLADPSRAAVVEAVAERLEPGLLLGLGSGRAVWALVQVLVQRWAGRRPRAVVASEATAAIAVEAGKATLGVVEHGLFLDQADEAILGLPDGSVEILSSQGDRDQR
jgi:ribose 5-phosphate isomerase